MTRWVIVGGGSAGCVIANRLSAVESNEVLLVEAGPDHGRAIGAPGEPVLDQPARLAPDVLVVRRPGSAAQTYAQGFGLGGSSLVNGGVVVGDPQAEAEGHDLPIETVTELGAVARAVLAATPEAGPVGVVRRSDRRVSAAEAYLDPVRGRDNLEIRADTAVAQLVLDRRRAVGVVTADGDHLDADRIVLCAGAIATPALLLRAGVDTAGVGVGLQDHAGIAISFDRIEPPSVEAGGAIIGATVERPGRQIVVMDRLPDRPDMGALIAGRLSIESEGIVTAAEPDGRTVVELNQLATATDRDGLVQVVTEAFELLRMPDVRSIVGEGYVDREGTPVTELEGDEDAVRAWLPSHLGSYHHVSASCRIGGPLDATGGLAGYEGVFVADASALPGVPLRNPYLTVVRLAEQLAARWVGSAEARPAGRGRSDR